MRIVVFSQFGLVLGGTDKGRVSILVATRVLHHCKQTEEDTNLCRNTEHAVRDYEALGIINIRAQRDTVCDLDPFCIAGVLTISCQIQRGNLPIHLLEVRSAQHANCYILE